MLRSSVGSGGVNDRVDVRRVQHLLNRFASPSGRLLRVDGLVGPRTLAAIDGFQRRHTSLRHPDRLVDPGGPTIRALATLPYRLSAPATVHAPSPRALPAHPSAPPGGGAPQVRPAPAMGRPAPAPADGARPRPLAWGAKVSPVFRQKVFGIADRIGIAPDFLMSCMAFESGESFSPSKRNGAGSGAIGLIQFMPGTARALHTTTEELAGMTAERQLDYVERYFQPYAHRLHSIEDIYMTILYPAAVGAGDDRVVFRARTVAYRQNRGLDRDRNGTVTVFEAAAAVRQKYHRGLQPGFIG